MYVYTTVDCVHVEKIVLLFVAESINNEINSDVGNLIETNLGYLLHRHFVRLLWPIC